MRSALYAAFVLSLSVATLGAPAADRDDDRRGSRGKLSVYKREPNPPNPPKYQWQPIEVFQKNGEPPKKQIGKRGVPGFECDWKMDPYCYLPPMHHEIPEDKGKSDSKKSPKDTVPGDIGKVGPHRTGDLSESGPSKGEHPTDKLPTDKLPIAKLPTGKLPKEGDEHSTDEHPTGKLPTGKLPTGKLPKEDLPKNDILKEGDEHSTDEHSTDEHPTGKLPTGKLPTGKLPTGKLPTGKLPTGKLPKEGDERPTDKLPTSKLPKEDQSEEDESEEDESEEDLPEEDESEEDESEEDLPKKDLHEEDLSKKKGSPTDGLTKLPVKLPITKRNVEAEEKDDYDVWGSESDEEDDCED